MLLLLVLASVSGQAHANQWNSIDQLVTASGDIRDTFDMGIKRIAGLGSLAATGEIHTTDGMLDTDAAITEQKRVAYNAALEAVQADIFSKTAAEYFTEQADNKAVDFGNAVNAFVSAATPVIMATEISVRSSEAQLSGDNAVAKELQQVINNDPAYILTTTEVVVYNDSLTTVELRAEQYATAVAIRDNQQFVDNFQSQADAFGLDFIDASDLVLSRFGNDAPEIDYPAAHVSFLNAAMTLTQDVTANFTATTELVESWGEADSFYTTGPTADQCFFATEVQRNDPGHPCYIPS